MRIIYITASMPYSSGETFLREEVRALVQRGHQVLVVPRSPQAHRASAQWLTECSLREGVCSGRVLRDAVRVLAGRPRTAADSASALLAARSLSLRMKNLAVFPKALWLARLATRFQADHMHCHWAGTTASMTMLASAACGIPWSLTAHRWDIVENNALHAKVKAASFVRLISEDGRRLMENLGIERERLRILRMGVKIPAPTASARPRNPIVLCPANLVEVKGHRYLIEAWRILRDRGFQGELWIAGDGELKNSLEKLAAHLHPDGGVKFLGRVAHERILRFYESGTISAVALASVDLGQGSHEGIPVALVEAMSYGIPVVATRTGGVPELVTSETGILTAPGDPVDLASGLEQALDGGGVAQRLQALARNHVARHHDVAAIAATLEEWFAESSNRSAQHPPDVESLQRSVTEQSPVSF